MRYYELTLTDASGMVFVPSARGDGFTKQASGVTFSSHPNGIFNPGALNIEFDFVAYPFHQAQGNTLIRVWGIGIGMISQASDLNSALFSLRAGMQKGLPLANPAQAGLIATGQIFQAFGNWQGVNQTLELICNPSIADVAQDILFSCPAGVSLTSAIAQVLTQAFPTYQQSINISSNLIVDSAQYGHYDSFAQLAGFINEYSRQLGMAVTGNKNYPGIYMALNGTTILVFDTTVPPAQVKQLAFKDLVGQPTWIDTATVDFKTVLRSDIVLGDTISFPIGITAPFALTLASAAAPGVPSRNKTAFQGEFIITEVHHLANFRQSDADSWVTVFNAVAT